MSTRTVTLSFPVLVQQLRGEWGSVYRVRPLFLSYPEASHRRFERAMSAFLREVRAHLRDRNTDRDSLEDLLWFGFHPDVNYRAMSFEFRSGHRLVSGEFGVASFKLQEHTVVCLPALDHYMFIASRDDNGKVRLYEQVEAVLQHLFREKRKEYGKDWNPEPLFAKKGEFLTTAELSVPVNQARLPFDGSGWDLISSLLGGETNFVGSQEMDKVATDLNLLYPYELRRAYEQDQRVERIRHVLFRKDNTAVVLLGPIGAGKTTLVHEAVRRHIEAQGNKQLFHIEKVWHLDPIRVIAGMSMVGQWQKRLEAILEYALKRLERQRKRGYTPTDKLFIDNPVALLRVGKSLRNDMTLSDVFKPYMEKQQLQVVLEATPEEWNLIQELDRGFADLFEVLRIPAVEPQMAARIASRQRARLEQEHNCEISNLALHRIFALQRAYMRQKALPGSVIDFLSQIATKYRRGRVDEQDVMKEFGATFQLHHHIFDRAVLLKEGEVAKYIKGRLIGQTEAADCLVDTVHLMKAGLNDPDKPVSAFLFIGPTGVGKTQAAKILARYLFQSEDNIVRFDMNEFVDGYAVSRLIGDLYHPEGQLTGRVRHRPFCVLLLDEIEKAHPQVHDLLLQLLGEGRLTDALGRTVDFTNTIVIMTSNVGAQEAGKVLGFGEKAEKAAGQYTKALETTFRPEFLNRIDRVVTFSPLNLEDVMAIARLQMEELFQRDGFLRRTTILSVSPKALEQVAQRGFDAELGGRALKRAIEKELTVLAAEQLVAMREDTPLLFEVLTHNGRLCPRVTPLLPVPAQTTLGVPEIPKDSEWKAALEELLDVASTIVAEINDVLDQTTQEQPKDRAFPRAGKVPDEAEVYAVESEYYVFRERVLELRDTLQELVWDLDVPSPEGMPRYKHKVKKSHDGWGAPAPDARALVAKMDICDYLRDIQITAPGAVAESQTNYLRYFCKLAFYRFFAQELGQQEQQRVFIQIASLVEERGVNEGCYLLECYKRALVALGLPPHEPASNEAEDTNEYWLFVQSNRVQTLLEAEQGVHMFYAPYEQAVPVRVVVGVVPEGVSEEEWMAQASLVRARNSGLEEDMSTPQDPGYIIRLYYLEMDPFRYALGVDYIRGTLTDLRTERSHAAQMSVDDWLLLLYAGLPDDEKIAVGTTQRSSYVDDGVM